MKRLLQAALALTLIVSVVAIYQPFKVEAVTCGFGTDNGSGLCVGGLTTGPGTLNQTFNVPADWNSASNSISCIGAGGDGRVGVTSSSAGGGGGGGAYSTITNLTLTPSGTATYTIGAHATTSAGNTANATYFNGTTAAGASVACDPGRAPSSATAAGAAGLAANSSGLPRVVGQEVSDLLMRQVLVVAEAVARRDQPELEKLAENPQHLRVVPVVEEGVVRTRVLPRQEATEPQQAVLGVTAEKARQTLRAAQAVRAALLQQAQVAIQAPLAVEGVARAASTVQVEPREKVAMATAIPRLTLLTAPAAVVVGLAGVNGNGSPHLGNGGAGGTYGGGGGGTAARQSKTHVQRQSAIHLMVEELRAGLRPSSPKPPEAVA